MMRAEIERECIGLSCAFAYHLDHREYRALADLFDTNGIWMRHGIELRGPDKIVAALEERPAAQFTRHITTGHYFTEVGQDHAAAHAYNMSYGSFEAHALPASLDLGLAMLLDFQDSYVRTAQGWRFLSRITTPVLIGEGVRPYMSGPDP